MTKKRPKEALVFDEIYGDVLSAFFEHLADERRSNRSYSLADALKSGYAIYALKSPSLFSFRQRTTAEDTNLLQLFGIAKIPSDNGLRKMLDGVDPDCLRQGFSRLYDWLKDKGHLQRFRSWQNHLIVSIDGVEHFCSKQISCAHCLSRNHRDGSRSFYHSMLSAALVKPGQREVFVMDNEPIVQQDGAKKNDCEQNAAKRLFSKLQTTHNEESIIFTMDALYGCAPIIRTIQRQEKWRYVIGVTQDGHKHLMEQFDELDEQEKVNWHSFRTKEGRYHMAYINGLSLNASAEDVKTNLLYCIWENNKGEQKVFSWVTNIRLTKKNVMKIMRIGRSRWKIENEVFNTLKNQSYNFEHNFGHGSKHLCTNFAFLMMMAFCVDQIQQLVCRIFQQLLDSLKTRLKLWEGVRIVFKTMPCSSMRDIYRNIAMLYKIKLE